MPLKFRHRVPMLKVGQGTPIQMVNPVSHISSTSHADKVLQAVIRPAQPQPPKQTATLVQDKVTLSKTKDVDHDGDSK